MIDMESEIFDELYTTLSEHDPDIFVSSEYVNAPAAFPAVSIIEMSNIPVTSTLSTSLRENHVSVMYEINVYSNLKHGKKQQAKAIAEVIDSKMMSMGFVRSIYTPVPNYADGTIFRILLRYTAVIDHNHTIYRKG